MENIGMDITSILGFTGCLFFTCNIIKSIAKFIKVLRILSDLKTHGIPNGFDEQNKKLNFYSKMFAMYMYIAMTIITFSSTVNMGYCFDKPACGMLIPPVMPFDIDHYPGKLFYFILKLVALILIYHTGGILSFAVMEVLEHIIFRLDDVKNKFVQALNPENPNRDKDLKEAIEYHNFVINVSQEYNEVIKPCMLVHVILTGVMLGATFWFTFVKFTLDSLVICLGYFTAMGCVSIGGQRLMEASESVADVVCTTCWYGVELKLQKALILVIARSRRPLYILAGTLGIVNFTLIIGTLKTAYSWMTLLTNY
ncbi:uncharacterized protein LOC109598695 isoform X2 [Aethina tumida]|nr:uncharacterized protein LOC109598695 isoform X2 [Aethina tumida]